MDSDELYLLGRIAAIWCGTMIVVLAVLAGTVAYAGTAEVAASIRYLQAKGVSHSQIFLFRENGLLLRQLTHNDTGQLKNPVFAPDGATIVFTRVLWSGQKDYWSVQLNGSHMHKLDTAPAWYGAAKSSPHFGSDPPEPTTDDQGKPQPSWDPTPTYDTPDGAQQLAIIRSEDGNKEGELYELRDLKSGKAVKLGDVPGWEILDEVMYLNGAGDAETVFLISPPLRAAFFSTHLNTTDGETTYALNLAKPRIVRLSPNWAVPVPLPGEPAFLTYTEERYRPIPGSPKTGNCSYIDYWGANLAKVRYGRATAAFCYGASMYRPGRTPPTITILNGDFGTPDGAPVEVYNPPYGE
jgi:hypothetical protein